MLVERDGISEQAVWKWRKRDSVHDRSHAAHRLQTKLTPVQEAVAVSLRKTLLLPLDDLLSVLSDGFRLRRAGQPRSFETCSDLTRSRAFTAARKSSALR
jgi:hypothetical protein